MGRLAGKFHSCASRIVYQNINRAKKLGSAVDQIAPFIMIQEVGGNRLGLSSGGLNFPDGFFEGTSEGSVGSHA